LATESTPRRSRPGAPAGPFDAELDAPTREDLGRRLRALLEVGSLDVRGMAQGLEVEPEVVVIALRELRAQPGGRLRSAIHLGRVTWTWERLPDEGAPEPPEGETEAGPSARRGKDRRAEDDRPKRSAKKGKAKGKKG
jgi:hypothetical protein